MHNCQNFELMFENFCIILREYSQIHSTLELCIVFRIITIILNKIRRINSYKRQYQYS